MCLGEKLVVVVVDGDLLYLTILMSGNLGRGSIYTIYLMTLSMLPAVEPRKSMVICQIDR